jgi:hypothetical protein
MHAPDAPAPVIGPDALDWLAPLRWTRLWGTHARSASTGLGDQDWAGVAWRSALGPALMATSPEAFADLYGDAEHPPAGAWSLSVRPGPAQGQADLELRLFGPLARHRPALLQALARLRMGPDAAPAGWRLGGWQDESALPLLRAAHDTSRAFALESLSPLALARPGAPGDTPPDTALVWRRLLSRLQQLQPPADRALPPTLRAWTDWVDRQPEQASAWQRVRGRRHSARQARQMPLSGWSGHIAWGPGSAALQPWWRLAQAVQLGAKTGFGLGAVRLRSAR